MSTTTTTNNSDSNNNIDNPLKVWKELTADDLVRGDTPVEIEQKCLNLCRSYVGGAWLEAQTVEDIKVIRVKGGLTNQLYKIELAQHIVARHPDAPSAIAFKLYFPKHAFLNDPSIEVAYERLSDTMVLTMAFPRKIVPEVYGIFPDGFLQRFHEHEQFSTKHQNDPKIVEKVARVLANIHVLPVPMAKEKNPSIEVIRTKIHDVHAAYDIDKMCKELNLEMFIKHDIRKEVKFLQSFVEEIDSPMVFSHNDFRGSNIMVTEPNNDIVVCDIEYSRYGPRAMDMATILVEWGRELFDFELKGLPSDEVIETFIQYYINEMNKLEPGYASKPRNSINAIKREVKAYFLIHRMFLLAFLMAKTTVLIAKMANTKEEDLQLSHPFYKDYFKIKEALIKDKLIQA